MSSNATDCGSVQNQVDFFGLRVGSIFVIMVTSLAGTLFPIYTRRSTMIQIPPILFELAKYFGSGVIIATAFIHLLSPATTELVSPCLLGAWQQYPFALAISMASVFGIFFLELFAFRWGRATLMKIGVEVHDAHGHGIGAAGGHAAHGPEAIVSAEKDPEGSVSVADEAHAQSVLDNAGARILGIAILEFGVLFHSVIIGLTLAVDPAFKILFVVIVFHQMFEGLGLGTRLSYLDLPREYRFVPTIGALLYGIMTPLGIAIGLGVRTTYNSTGTTASIVSGVLDSISSGILLYTGLVELLAHEFLFNPDIHKWSNARLAFSLITMLFGAGIMALLGRWA